MDGTIVICTYNGAERLPDTLAYLAALQRPGQWQVLLVDNASTDNTAEAAAIIWAKQGNPYPLHIVQQPLPGKSNALMLGFQQAGGQLAIICDDDNLLAPDYLIQAVDFMANHPAAGILGGAIEAVSVVPLPHWFEEAAEAYACGNRGPKPQNLTGVAATWGAGMVLRLHLARLITHPQLPQGLTCRIGDQLVSGGDDELCLRAWLLGYQNWYLPTLRLQHAIPPARLTIAYRDKLIAGFKLQAELVNAYRRLFQVQKITTPFFIIKQLMAYILALIGYRTNNKKVAAEFLFFKTRIKFFESSTSSFVLGWYEKILVFKENF